MNPVDVAIGLLLVIFAVRGFLRGFFRESFGLLALLAGLAAALQLTTTGAAIAAEWLRRLGAAEWTEGALSEPALAGIAFLTIFMVVHGTFNLLGFLLDRVASSLLVRGVNRLAGLLFGAGKGGAIIAFVLLFLHLFPTVLPDADPHIMNSQIARPLIAFAGTVIRVGWQPGEAARPADSASAATKTASEISALSVR